MKSIERNYGAGLKERYLTVIRGYERTRCEARMTSPIHRWLLDAEALNPSDIIRDYLMKMKIIISRITFWESGN